MCGIAARFQVKGCAARQERPLWSWEAGGGRVCRQPGQVRKEAALTILDSGRSSVSFYSLTGAVRIEVDRAPSARAALAAGRLAPSPFGRYGIQDHGQEKDHRHRRHRFAAAGLRAYDGLVASTFVTSDWAH